MRVGSVCSGIEAATLAWKPLGWECAFMAEIEKFPRAVLSHHFPNTPLHGDFTTIGDDEYGPIDVLVGGTPCQAFSVAGLRGGMADARGGLALEFLRLAARKRPKWLVWENVPGVLSSSGGRDFGAFLGGLAELGYGWAYRVLDAQYFGIPQRRRRVFVVGCLGDSKRAAAVLFERASLSGHPTPRREAGPIASALTANGVGGGGGADDNSAQANHPIAFSCKDHGADAGDIAPTLRAMNHNDSHANGGGQVAVAAQWGVRRITPVEAERLQGIPDDWTLVPYRGKPAADGPRYRAIGNSFAVPVVRWIGERIQRCELAVGPNVDACSNAQTHLTQGAVLRALNS